jgi:flavin reductase (DIM6/NTAB) family NADH-FMN oxidoreductase RutF
LLKSTDQIVMHSYPGIVALVTSHYDNVENIMAAGWHSYISYDPPIYGVAIAKERFSHQLVLQSGEFAINFLPAHLADKIQKSGTLSGSTENKLKTINLKYKKGEIVASPVLIDAYVVYECKVIDINTYGDHDWIVAEIKKFHRNDDKFMENGLPDLNKLQIPLYLGRSKYAILDNKIEIKDYY